jgi:hypothetical protein
MEKRIGLSGFQLTALIIAAFAIAFPAIYNGYPLLYSDSGNYIEHACSLIPSIDRAVGYSYFIRCATWQASIWPVVIFQGLIGSWLVFLVMRMFIPPHLLLRTFTVVILTLGCFSSMGWYASLVTPDVFSSYLPLSIFLLLFGQLKKFTRVLLYLLVVFIITMHFSHLAIAAGLVMLAVSLKKHWKIQFQSIGLIAASCLMGHQIICFSNYSEYGTYTFSRSSYVFLMGRLSETGILKAYLSQNCDEPKSNLCDHIDGLPKSAAEFIWDPNSPFAENGPDWSERNSEYQTIVMDIVTSPIYWPSLFYQSMVASIKQMTRIRIGSGIGSYGDDSAPFNVLSRRIPNELNEYLQSREYFNTLPLATVNLIDGLLLFLSVVLLVNWSTHASLSIELKAFIILIAVSYILNAFVTGSLANVYDRLQARMTWLIILAAITTGYVLFNQVRSMLRPYI